MDIWKDLPKGRDCIMKMFFKALRCGNELFLCIDHENKVFTFVEYSGDYITIKIHQYNALVKQCVE